MNWMTVDAYISKSWERYRLLQVATGCYGALCSEGPWEHSVHSNL